MTLENFLSQIGMGTKPLIDRHSEYGGAVHDQHVYYAYEPSAPSHGHVATSKHNYGGGHKSGASMSALTLLAFLFFLHILQQCIKDHMTEMSTPPVMIMTAGREGETIVSKSADSHKIDKTGVKQVDSRATSEFVKNNVNKQYKTTEEANRIYDGSNKSQFKKIDTTAFSSKDDEQKYKYIYKNYANRSNFPGFVSAMEED